MENIQEIESHLAAEAAVIHSSPSGLQAAMWHFDDTLLTPFFVAPGTYELSVQFPLSQGQTLCLLL